MSERKVDYTTVRPCAKCKKKIEGYRPKSNICERCYKKFIEEEFEFEKMEKKRSKWR